MPASLFGRIAVAVDGSAHADRALDFAIDLAKKYGGELTLIAVAPLIPLYIASSEAWIPSEIPEAETKLFRQIVDQGTAKAKAAGAPSVTGVCLEGVIVDEILGYLEVHPADLLVVGSRGLSTAKRLLLGSVSDAIAHHSGCPLLIVRAALPAQGGP
jgi:nucleotide-binding universal stress UspA family protein